jgi:Domain of unknown function (DUF4824)
MRRRRLFAAAALVAAVNTVVLLGVARNRSGGGPALTLTERELPVTWRSPSGENSGVSLSFNCAHWLPGGESQWPFSGRAWLVGEKLRDLGFDLDVPLDPTEAGRFVQRQGSRRAFAVLKLGGKAWEDWLASVEAGLAKAELDLASGKITAGSLEVARKNAADGREHGSRLFVVDAGRDADALRGAYPDRAQTFLLPAEVRLTIHCDIVASACPPERRQVRGVVTLLIDGVSVPHQLQAGLPSPAERRGRAESGLGHAPRYEVALRVGSRHEPWVESTRPLTQ